MCQCAKILQKVNLIEADLPEQFHDFIEIFDGINEVRYTTYGNTLSYCSPRPAPYFENVVKNLEEKKYDLRKKFGVTIPNKWHYVIEHVSEYIDDNNLSLGRTSDQVIESTHQHTNKLFTRSKYHVKDISSPAHKKGLKNGVNHYNSYNV